jgi:hypothetical protein
MQCRGEVRTEHFRLPYIISAPFIPRSPSEHQKVLELYRKGPLTFKELGLRNISWIFQTHPFFLARQRKTIILLESFLRGLPNFKFYVAFLSPSGEYQKYLEVANHRSLPFNLISLHICSLAVLEPEVKKSPAVNYAPSNKGMWWRRDTTTWLRSARRYTEISTASGIESFIYSSNLIGDWWAQTKASISTEEEKYIFIVCNLTMFL